MSSTQTPDRIVITNNIEAILTSLDGIKRAEAPPYLFGRIKARLSQPKHSFFETFSHFISRPVVAISFLILILFTDGIIFQSTLTTLPAKYENTTEEFLTSDDLAESLFYDTPENEYAYFLLVQE